MRGLVDTVQNVDLNFQLFLLSLLLSSISCCTFTTTTLPSASFRQLTKITKYAYVSEMSGFFSEHHTRASQWHVSSFRHYEEERHHAHRCDRLDHHPRAFHCCRR